MKIKHLGGALALALILFSGCKKADVKKDPDISINADGTLKIDDADGAFYTTESKTFMDYNDTDFEEVQYAFAWVGKFPFGLADAGMVKVNDIEITNTGNFYTAFAPLSFGGDTLYKNANADAAWTIQGNSASGVAAFSHTDNTTLPTAPAFTLPASVNINNSLTISHTPTGGALGVLYKLTGDYGDTTKFVANNSGGITFTAAEVKAVAETGSQVLVSIMGVTYTSATYGGKKYYFVKQNQYTRQTSTL